MIKMADFLKGKRRLALIIGVLALLGLGALLLTSGVTKENPPDANHRSEESQLEGKTNTIKLMAYPEKYTPAMSSTPGIRIAVEYPDFVGQVRYTAANGTLFTDANSTSRVSTIELAYDRPVYWSPFETNGQLSTEEYNPIYIAFLDEKGKEIAEKRLTINYYDSLYNVRPELGIFIGTKTTSSSTEKARNMGSGLTLT